MQGPTATIHLHPSHILWGYFLHQPLPLSLPNRCAAQQGSAKGNEDFLSAWRAKDPNWVDLGGICSFTTSGPTNAKGECLMKQKGYKQKHNQNISYSTNKCLSNCSRNISCLSCDCVVCLFVVFDPWYTSPPSHSTPQWPAWELRPKRSGRTGRLAPSMASLLLRRKPTALYTDESAGQCGRYMVNCQGTR